MTELPITAYAPTSNRARSKNAARMSEADGHHLDGAADHDSANARRELVVADVLRALVTKASGIAPCA